MPQKTSAIRLPGFMKNIGKQIGNVGRATSTGSRRLGRQLSGGRLKNRGARGLGFAAPAAAGVGAAYGAGGMMDAMGGDEPSLAEQLGNRASQLGDQAAELGETAVGGINRAGDAVAEAFDEEGAVGGLFQEGGALGGLGDWWRGLDPETKQAIIYSAIAGGAGLGGYGLFKAFSGGQQRQPAYY